MHVLLVPSSYPRFYKTVSGVFYREQAVALARNGVTVGVIDPAARSLATVREGRILSTLFQVTSTADEGIRALHANDWCLPMARRLHGRQFVARARGLFSRYVAEFGRPDLLHAHSAIWGGVGAAAVSERVGIPFVITEHSGDFAMSMLQPWKPPLLESVFARAADVIVVSADLRRRLKPYIRDREATVVPNVVDTDYFAAGPTRDRSGPFVFASVGSQVTGKGIDVLLRAFAAAFQDHPAVRLEIGGEGAERTRFEAMARLMGIKEQVRWLGALDRDGVRNCLWRADAFVLPSRYETFGVVFIEAMSTGLPVIATRCGGPEDFVDPDCGFLVEVGNVSQTAAAMRSVYENRAVWRSRAESIRRRTIERFSQPVVAGQLKQLYARVLSAEHSEARS